MANKQEFINDLKLHGRQGRGWGELANLYGYANGESARTSWKNYKVINKIQEKQEVIGYVTALEDRVLSLEEDLKNNKAELTYRSKEEIRTLEELITKTNIDLKKWKIVRWRQNYWGNINDPHWQVRAELEPLNKSEEFTNKFIDFLNVFKPHKVIPVYNSIFNNNKSLVIINKQDSHLNKYDELGNNDIEKRFNSVEEAIHRIISKAELFSEISVKYIIGSDEFNSEYTQTTTKGTPQRNIGSFHEEFEKICEHEIRVILNLLEKATELEVVYIPGNHDEYVGWHLIHWLKAYFRDQKNITFDISPEPTKYYRFSNTALMFNHGNDMKPQKLAQIFPVEFNKEWSNCSYYYIFTGDKHTEKSMDFSGITFYALPALSTGKSNWDLKMGNVGNKAEVTAFVIQEGKGISDIYKEPIYA